MGGKRVIRIAILRICFVLLLAPPVLFGQCWPLPAKTPNTEVACTPCPDGRNGVTVGYSSPISIFTGRFLDSQITQDLQQPFRTARAKQVILAPERNRIYLMIGSAVAAYDINTFFTRLEAGEAMIPVTMVPVKPAPSNRAVP